MKIREVGTRGILFTFDDETSVYLINAEQRLILCDTHLGPASMDSVKQYIDSQQWNQKELVVFNSHSDWDHIWGNCAFENATIIGHEFCRRRMQERGEFDLAKMPAKFQQGKVELKLPNLTFSQKLAFPEDEIEFIYAPGHTICSAICYDRKDSVVYVGDLLEYPVPFVLYSELEDFIESLELIKHLSAEIIISAHSGIVEEKLLDENLAYIRNVLMNNPVELGEDFQSLHDFNRKNVLILKHEKIAREKLGDKFDFLTFMREFWGTLGVKEEDLARMFATITQTNYEDLAEALKRYIANLQ